MRIVKCVRGKGLYANPTGGVEFHSTFGCIPHVNAAEMPAIDCLGVFLADFPRVISVSRYRFVRTGGSGDLRMRVRVDRSAWTVKVSGVLA